MVSVTMFAVKCITSIYLFASNRTPSFVTAVIIISSVLVLFRTRQYIRTIPKFHTELTLFLCFLLLLCFLCFFLLRLLSSKKKKRLEAARVSQIMHFFGLHEPSESSLSLLSSLLLLLLLLSLSLDTE